MWIQRAGSVQPWFQMTELAGTLLTPLLRLGMLVVVRAPGSSPSGAYFLPDSCSRISSCEFFRFTKTSRPFDGDFARQSFFLVESVAFLVGGMFSLSGLGG